LDFLDIALALFSHLDLWDYFEVFLASCVFASYDLLCLDISVTGFMLVPQGILLVEIVLVTSDVGAFYAW